MRITASRLVRNNGYNINGTNHTHCYSVCDKGQMEIFHKLYLKYLVVRSECLFECGISVKRRDTMIRQTKVNILPDMTFSVW